MTTDPAIVADVDSVYRHIDEIIAAWHDPKCESTRCSTCGQCCDFDSYGHRLFVTSPELVYFATKLGSTALKPMTTGLCPYNAEGRCTVHAHRFAGCRIFFCKADPDRQSALSEWALARFKEICLRYDLAYSYVELRSALNCLTTPAR